MHRDCCARGPKRCSKTVAIASQRRPSGSTQLAKCSFRKRCRHVSRPSRPWRSRGRSRGEPRLCSADRRSEAWNRYPDIRVADVSLPECDGRSPLVGVDEPSRLPNRPDSHLVALFLHDV